MTPSEPPIVAEKPKRPLGRTEVLFFRGLGWLAVALATAGVFLPLMPTTVFLLVAAWAFARGSPQLRTRLYADKRFGPFLRDWEERGAIPVRAKVLAVVGMSVGFAIVVWRSSGLVMPIVAGVVILGGAAFVLSRPS
ncbi:MAG TPA: YbaN family protein [Phenylobacterium sp.]